jgi:hypothetical protein
MAVARTIDPGARRAGPGGATMSARREFSEGFWITVAVLTWCFLYLLRIVLFIRGTDI